MRLSLLSCSSLKTGATSTWKPFSLKLSQQQAPPHRLPRHHDEGVSNESAKRNRQTAKERKGRQGYKNELSTLFPPHQL